MIGPVMLCRHGANRRVQVALGVEPRLGLQVAALHHLVGLVIAVPRIDRADDRKAVEHRRLLGQVLADEDARQLRGGDAERTAVFHRPIRLGVPGVDVAGPAGHP